MADLKISQLPEAAALTSAELAPLVQSGGNVKATIQQITTAVTGATGTNGETVTTDKPRLDLTQTWDAVGTTFTGLKFNATDTASAAASLLMDLQVGGASRFKVSKDGNLTSTGTVTFQNTTNSTTAWRVLNAAGTSIADVDTTNRTFSAGAGSFAVSVATGVTSLYNNGALGWTNAGTALTSLDLSLFRDAADTLAQRRTTNAQTFRIYNTFTDASNYERGKMEWASNVLRIGTEKAGTGTARELQLQTDGVTRLTVSTTGTVTVAATGASFVCNGSVTGTQGFNIGNGNSISASGAGSAALAFSSSTTAGATHFFFNHNFVTGAGKINYKDSVITDAGNIEVGTTTGTKIGTATTQKIAFYNSTPVVQPNAVADATDAATAITQLNALLAHMRTLGLIAT